MNEKELSKVFVSNYSYRDDLETKEGVQKYFDKSGRIKGVKKGKGDKVKHPLSKVLKHEAAIILFVDNWWKIEFHPPPLREISKGCGGLSLAVISYTLYHMEDKGLGSFMRNKYVPRWVKNAIMSERKKK